MNKRQVLMAALCLAASATAFAQQGSTRIVVSFSPGGPVDFVARTLAVQLSKELGRTVLVENKPGANGAIGATEVLRAEPDGNTIWISSVGAAAINPALYDKLPYDTIRDFVPVTQTVIQPLLFSVPAASPARTVAEYLELARKDARAATVCSPGNGSGPHLAMELLAWASGAPLVHVPYKGDAPAVNDLVGGQVGACFNAQGTPLPHVRSGRLRALAVVARERTAQLPDTPTFAEVGLRQVDAYAWFGLLAPAGTPREVVDRLNQEVNMALKNPEVLEKFAGIGAIAVGGSAAEFERFLRADLDKWSRVVKERGIKPD